MELLQTRTLSPHLRRLEAEGISILRETAASFRNPVLLYSIGKDSSVVLHLAMKAFAPGHIPFPLLHIATGWDFRDMLEFRDRRAAELGARLFVLFAVFDLVEFALLTLLLVGGAMAFGLLGGRDFRALFPFDLMMALWGSLTLATLVTQAGFDGVMAGLVVDFFGLAGNLATVVAIFLLAWVLTELLSNVAAAVMALPIALQFAAITGLPPEAAALMAAFGASASFLVPYGIRRT